MILVPLTVLILYVEMLKNIFLDVKRKFETAIGVLRKEKITIDPADPAAVSQYAKVMKTVREKYGPKYIQIIYLDLYIFQLGGR